MNAPQSLRDIVLIAMDKHGLSGRQLAFKAQDHGFNLAITTVNHLKAGTYKSQPTDETVRALAWLAGVPEAVAFAAAGKPTPGPPLADELPPGADTLSPKSRKAVIDLMRVLIDLEQAAASDTATTHPTAHLTDSELQAALLEDARPQQKSDMGLAAQEPINDPRTGTIEEDGDGSNWTA